MSLSLKRSVVSIFTLLEASLHLKKLELLYYTERPHGKGIPVKDIQGSPGNSQHHGLSGSIQDAH